MSTSPLFGTAGWSYPHWNGLVYPKAHGSGFHALEFLARGSAGRRAAESEQAPAIAELTNGVKGAGK